MTHTNINKKGFKTFTKTKVCKCPLCGYLTSTGFTGVGEKEASCPKCQKTFLSEKMLWGDVDAIECFCGNVTPLLPEHTNEIHGDNKPFDPDERTTVSRSYLCDQCKEWVGVDFDGKTWSSNEILQVKWNNEILKRVKPIEGELYFAEVKTSKDWIVSYLLTKLAKKENREFLSHSDGCRFCILLNDSEYIGYVIWFPSKPARLNQIFVKSSHRGKGYGLKLLKFWVENVADKISEKFQVESPNKKSLKMLLKLGYITRERTGIKDGKCIIILSPGYMMSELD